MTCLYILDSYEHLISDSCNMGDCAVIHSVWLSALFHPDSPGEPGNRGDDSSSSHVAAGLIRCDMKSDVCRNRKSCSSFFSSRRAWMLFYTCWYWGFVQMRAALIQVQTTISWSDSGLKTASRRNKTNRTSSLTNNPADTHLLLGDEGGALTVHGVVGEVVREGFGSIPRRLPCDAFRELLGNQRAKIIKKDTCWAGVTVWLTRGGEKYLQVGDGGFVSFHPDDALCGQVLLPVRDQERHTDYVSSLHREHQC